jgi:hypothetical protein
MASTGEGDAAAGLPLQHSTGIEHLRRSHRNDALIFLLKPNSPALANLVPGAAVRVRLDIEGADSPLPAQLMVQIASSGGFGNENEL